MEDLSTAAPLLATPDKLGSPPFKPLWPNTKALRIGFLAGQGYNSPGIERFLGDGTIGPTIRAMLGRAGVDLSKGNCIPLPLSKYEVQRLNDLAHARGLTPLEWLTKVASAALRDDLFDAVVDEEPPKKKLSWGGDRCSEKFLTSMETR